jgi:hypothetical protein
VTETIWSTVDRLIRDLGAIRAFVDEAEALPETSAAPEVADVRGAMDTATDAITHLFTDNDAVAVQAAWSAIAHAQDAVTRARELVASARAGHEAAQRLRELNRGQLQRARDHRDVLLDRVSRLRGNRRPAATDRDPDAGS